jgi:hypothetical protein
VYTITGSQGVLLASRIVIAESGVCAITGAQAATLAHRLIALVPGVYVLTGSDAVLTGTGVVPVITDGGRLR